ncbi:VOC family protein [Algibacillus agarilyticus]|uniref:VOC family protein n=1 Tax=Algibacillus agarilyticus TaxID=2234133 RepID=UPI000DCF6ACD|nr:VOC family protein [Algibacillus agarilyticus]
MTNTTLKGIHHAAIICDDYAVSKHFYTSILGLAVVAENYRAERDSYKLELQLPDGCQIELFSFPNRPERPSYPEAKGLRHLAFSVDSIDVFVEYSQSDRVLGEAVKLRDAMSICSTM